MGAWYDKHLPDWIDASETYGSAGGAAAGGVLAPMALSATYDQAFGKPKTFEGKFKRTIGAKALVSVIAELLFHGKKASHDEDPKNTNMHMINAATVAPALIWDAIQQHREDKKAEKERKARLAKEFLSKEWSKE